MPFLYAQKGRLCLVSGCLSQLLNSGHKYNDKTGAENSESSASSLRNYGQRHWFCPNGSKVLRHISKSSFCSLRQGDLPGSLLQS
eukprot:symbB.v1.2.021011.t1/scaffold1777.1/size101761/6